MTSEFKKHKLGEYTLYTLESMTAGGTGTSAIATSATNSKKSGANLLTPVEGAQKKVPASKPRNFVAKNAKTGGAGAHKDKKKAEKQGDIKHKKPYAESIESLKAKLETLKEAFGRRDAYQRDYDSSVSGMGRPYDHRGLGQELAHERNNYAVTIDGRTWKVFADQRQAQNIARSLQAKGKKAAVMVTGADPSEGVAEGFGSNYAEQLAQKIFDQNPDLDNEDAILNLGYNIAKSELGSRAQGIFRDEDFPSDLLSAYNWVKEEDDYYGLPNRDGRNEGVAEGASDVIGNAIEDLRVSKPGMDIETFLDELYFYLDAEWGKQAADQVANADDATQQEWYANYSDMAEDAVADFLARGGQIQHGKTHKPRKAEKWQGSGHIGTGRGGKAQNASGMGANTRKDGNKPVVSTEAAPKGWEGTVKAMKKHDEIDNPWALAHYMKNKGYKSHKKESVDPYLESLSGKLAELKKKM